MKVVKTFQHIVAVIHNNCALCCQQNRRHFASHAKLNFSLTTQNCLSEIYVIKMALASFTGVKNTFEHNH